MDNSKLTDAQWKRAVIYKALAEYIYPQLTEWKDPGVVMGKMLSKQIEFYRAKYAEEFQCSIA